MDPDGTKADSRSTLGAREGRTLNRTSPSRPPQLDNHHHHHHPQNQVNKYLPHFSSAVDAAPEEFKDSLSVLQNPDDDIFQNGMQEDGRSVLLTRDKERTFSKIGGGPHSFKKPSHLHEESETQSLTDCSPSTSERPIVEHRAVKEQAQYRRSAPASCMSTSPQQQQEQPRRATWGGVQPTAGTATAARQDYNEDAHHHHLRDGASTEDSILNSILREQFQNSVIRLPFVPAEVTGRDVTVEPSVEPQVPIAVAAFRRVSHNEDGASMIRTPMPMPPPTNRTLSSLDESGASTATEVHNWHHPYNVAAATGGLPIKEFNELRQQGFPQGLALEVGGSRASLPVRFWSIDNSSGMDSDHYGSKQVKFHPDRGRTTIERCSRWNELQGSMEDQIRLAGLMGFSSVFCLRNGESGQRKFSVADPTSASVANDVKRAIQTIQQAPALGYTPLEKHVREFANRVNLLASTLNKQKQKAVCVFGVGNLPADGRGHVSERTKQQFLKDLAELGRLPVLICIRLCTDDKNVADFYHRLMHTGLPVVVIDDFLTEAKKIQEHNPWLNYALCLHRGREMGYHNRVFSSLQRQQLDKDELRELLVILFGKKAMLAAPDIHTEWKRFYKFMSTLNEQEGKHWNARTKKVESWIDLRKLDKAYNDGGVTCGRRRLGSLGSLFGSWKRGSTSSSSPPSHQDPHPRRPAYAVLDI